MVLTVLFYKRLNFTTLCDSLYERSSVPLSFYLLLHCQQQAHCTTKDSTDLMHQVSLVFS